MRFAVSLGCPVDRADIERGMRPGGLREILDDAGNPVVAFDQQDVALLDNAPQMFRVARRERLIARHFLLKVARDQLADGIEHCAHFFPPGGFAGRFLSFLIMVESRCNLVHASARSIMIDSP